MKKLFALVLVCALCLGSAALAAEWREGLSPSKPYAGVREIDLTEEFGYWVFYPSQKNDGKNYAEYFCDVLEIYMPDPGVQLGEGTATLWDENSEPVCVIDFADPTQVELRDMEEEELDSLMWGSGVCVEMFLPISLEFGKAYYVTFEQGVMTTNEGKVLCQFIPYDESKPVTEQYWSPAVASDYGISGLYYSAAPEEAEPTEDEEADEADEPAEEEAEAAPAEPKYNPGKGDIVTFDVVLGGDAVAAVMYSENDSVYFPTMEMDENGRVTGIIQDDDVRWGVVFVDADGNPVVIDPDQEILAVFDMSPINRGEAVPDVEGIDGEETIEG